MLSVQINWKSVQLLGNKQTMNMQQIANEWNLKKSCQLLGKKTKMNINRLRTNKSLKGRRCLLQSMQEWVSETNKQDDADEYSTELRMNESFQEGVSSSPCGSEWCRQASQQGWDCISLALLLYFYCIFIVFLLYLHVLYFYCILTCVKMQQKYTLTHLGEHSFFYALLGAMPSNCYWNTVVVGEIQF